MGVAPGPRASRRGPDVTGASVRPPAVAGSFYPADPDTLRAAVNKALRNAATSSDTRPPKAIVVPHAGYEYSGPVAASAYRRLLPLHGVIEHVTVFGPAHRWPVPAAAVSGARAFETPLGPVPIDWSYAETLVADGVAVSDDEAHAQEHSIEVQLPFVQVVLGDVVVLPIAVGNLAPHDLTALFEHVWGSKSLIVVSTDLSHYHDHATAQRLDRRTADAIVAKDAEAIRVGDACGAVALRGLLAAARADDLSVELLDLRTSADTAGDPDSVVGYGAFAVG